MSIVITLDAELEQRLRTIAEQQEQDISVVAAELLATALTWEEQDSAEVVKGIQQGLNDFEADRYQVFDDFAAAQRQKYDLPTQ